MGNLRTWAIIFAISQGMRPGSLERKMNTVPERDAATYAIIFMGLILLLAVCYIARSILIPFAIAVLLAYLLYPVVAFLNRRRVPYGLAVALVIAVLLALLFSAGVFLAGQANSLARSLPAYMSGIQAYLQKVAGSYDALVRKAADILPGVSFSRGEPVNLANLLGGMVNQLFSTLLSLIGIFSNFLMVIFMLILILIDARMFKDKLLNAWGEGNRDRAKKIVRKLNRDIQGFLAIRTLINIALGGVMTLALLLLGVDYAYIWGPLTGLLNYIPYIGAFVAALPPVLITLATHNTLTMPLVVAGVYLLIQNIEGNYLSPRLIGNRVNLNSLTVLLGLIVWGFLWGPIGMIISTPLTTCFKIVCDQIDLLKPIGVLMEGSGEKPGKAA